MPLVESYFSFSHRLNSKQHKNVKHWSESCFIRIIYVLITKETSLTTS